MKVQAGYLLNDTFRMHPIKNLLIKPIEWTTIELIVDGNIITKICNNGNNINFSMTFDDNYMIVLKVNNNTYYCSNNLFNYELNIDIENNNSNIIEYIDNIIYDG